MDLTQYQRGNRDGLLALAKWADEMSVLHKKEYEAISNNIVANSLSGLRYEMTASVNLHRAQVYKDVAAHARRLSEALPIDPEIP
ncbi:MAG: hypothetical protein EB127_24720 [Alphaproteobacteria bacterium]|nr:hypothetical protein [Alphaproteobacteria bacterium]